LASGSSTANLPGPYIGPSGTESKFATCGLAAAIVRPDPAIHDAPAMHTLSNGCRARHHIKKARVAPGHDAEIVARALQ